RDRALERYAIVNELLEKEFDFSEDEYFETDYEKATWSANREQLKDRWRLILKSQAISYKLAGKEWPAIQQALKERYKRQTRSIYQYNSEDVFQSYMNAITSAYDPHTSYFSPISSQNFQIEMSLSLEGIGARLSQQLDYTVVADVVPGGPAYKSKVLQPEDKIIGVAQGDEGEFIDVIGWRLDDVVQKIRGPKGSVVRLQILKKGDLNALPDTLRLVREKIKLEDEAAQAELIPFTIGETTYNLGVITVPSFYLNFEDRSQGLEDYKSTTRDVKTLIEDLKGRGMDALMIDLRFNGGGSLQEAIDMTGLFIPRGPVVQVKNVDGSVESLYDEDGNTVFYDGPLMVLTNRYSASASEIFSGAIQDYNRGMVVGENSFGKGTVQNLIDLDRPVLSYITRLASYRQASNRDVSELIELRNQIQSGEVKLGQLKLTLAKFYRATGSSTQRVGVVPDVMFPTPFDHDAFGESSRPNALPWDEIPSSKFVRTNQVTDQSRDQLYKVYLSDLMTDEQLKKLTEEIEEVKSDQLNTRISLNVETRRAEEEQERASANVKTVLPEGLTTEAYSEKLADDAYLKEGLRLLAELTGKKGK
ncbi:MAG: carboxy terminal-processing peptidase, partial [Cyclobacteriaceae bacterium]|nr:carboxy terminal-processing peptidase [Cyclobacteriaceae bacterium]